MKKRNYIIIATVALLVLAAFFLLRE